ncbi:TlpA family protein disulfide reductase [Akkermansiaceae bacterium]|nr:TlpA family protein disulfide reductase [Akkermansiaceae bacterium]
MSVVWGQEGAARAKGLVRAYDQKFDAWVELVKNAKSKEARVAAWQTQPDSKAYGQAVWKEIKPNLDKSWTLEYAAWIMSTIPEVVAVDARQESSPLALIRKAFKDYHIKSPRVGPYCLALTLYSDPGDMIFLQMVEKQNPDKAVQGAAALGQAILLRNLGDAPEVMQKRLAKLEKAIKSPDLKIGRTTLQKLVEDETFRTTKLSVGAKAPDVRGIDITGEVFKLSDYKDKVVVFVFWTSWMPNAQETLSFLNKLHEEAKGKDLVIIGACQDSVVTLRDYTKDGRVLFRNFADFEQAIETEYRVSRWPQCYVLDKEGKIQYKGEPGPFVRISAMAILGQ